MHKKKAKLTDTHRRATEGAGIEVLGLWGKEEMLKWCSTAHPGPPLKTYTQEKNLEGGWWGIPGCRGPLNFLKAVFDHGDGAS